MYHQQLQPLGSLALSALVAALPLIVLFVLLGLFKMKAWLASLIGLGLAAAVALIVYGMPWNQVGMSAVAGFAFGVFPAMWVVVNALWIHNMTVKVGAFDVIQRSFVAVSGDTRIQGLVIAFCFGAVLEALAGFGAPVAICAVLLVSIGLSPLKAATAALVANTAPVAYGAVGLPIVTLSAVTGLPARELSRMTAHQVPLLALLVPFVLMYLLDGRKGLRETWPVALACGLSFAVTQFVMASWGPFELTDIAAGLVSALVVVAFVMRSPRFRRSPSPATGGGLLPASGAAAPAPTGGVATAVDLDTTRDTMRDRLVAFSPYIVVIALFSTASIPWVKETIGATTVKVDWPVLDVLTASGEPSSVNTYNFDWLINGGTVLLLAGLISAVLLRVPRSTVAVTYGETLSQVKLAAVTVTSVLAMAYVMNASGQTVTMGVFLAGTGGLFAVLSLILGWFGVAVTGSDTSSNSLFGALQVAAAHRTGISEVLLAAANTSGGVLGKMLSPQNLAIGAAAVGLSGREGDLFRKVLVVTAVFLPLMCLLVFLQSTSVLGWMVP